MLLSFVRPRLRTALRGTGFTTQGVKINSGLKILISVMKGILLTTLLAGRK